MHLLPNTWRVRWTWNVIHQIFHLLG